MSKPNWPLPKVSICVSRGSHSICPALLSLCFGHSVLKVEDAMNRDAIEVGAFSWARIQRLWSCIGSCARRKACNVRKTVPRGAWRPDVLGLKSDFPLVPNRENADFVGRNHKPV